MQKLHNFFLKTHLPLEFLFVKQINANFWNFTTFVALPLSVVRPFVRIWIFRVFFLKYSLSFFFAPHKHANMDHTHTYIEIWWYAYLYTTFVQINISISSNINESICTNGDFYNQRFQPLLSYNILMFICLM